MLSQSPKLLIGNGINNVSNNQSWEELLIELTKHLHVFDEIKNIKTKPFPLLYEEILMRALQKNPISESGLKKRIADLVNNIKGNQIHKRIMTLGLSDILTTNYEYSLQAVAGLESKNLKNLGHIEESTYSIFRHNKVRKSKIWHIHGECNYPKTIALGYEHYGGLLQHMRNYVVSGTNYSTERKNLEGLIRRLKTGAVKSHSWLDFFFTDDIHIIGLSLDTSEVDLWWLITYRARMKSFPKSKIFDNTIIYYYPSRLEKEIQNKLELLQANCIQTVRINTKDKMGFYRTILNTVEKIIDGKIKKL